MQGLLDGGEERAVKRKGVLAVVGTGIESMGQMTPAALREIRRAQRLFYLAADPITERTLRGLNRRAVDLHPFYAEGKHRLRTYAQMTERVLEEVRRGLRVCLALYGHPGVFAMPAHAAVSLARSEGHRAVMLPAISADACMIADLGVDPAAGWQSYEATDFLLRGRRADPAVGLVLWQVGVVGRLDYPSGPVHRDKLAVLTEVLLQTYPRRHLATLYEAATLPGFPAAIERVQNRLLAPGGGDVGDHALRASLGLGAHRREHARAAGHQAVGPGALPALDASRGGVARSSGLRRRRKSQRPAGSAVKSAASASRKAPLVTSPNWRSGGKLENDSARKPAALMKVAKAIAPPATRSACSIASPSGAPSRSCRWWKKWHFGRSRWCRARRWR